MEVTVNVINAFSIGETGGNPAGVVFDADNFTNEQKQLIASKAGFPETAFVSSSAIADFKLDFFTPIKQIPHCGHATIAAFSYLRKQGKITKDFSSKETIDGVRAIHFINGLAFMEQRAPTMKVPEQSIESVLESLDIGHDDLKPGLDPTIVNTGNSFLIVPLKNENILKTITPDSEKVFEFSRQHDLIGYYLYASPQNSEEVDATSRMFAPFYGIEEEAGTGMAAGPLATFLYKMEKMEKKEMVIEQGRYMKKPSPSIIYVKLNIQDEMINNLFAGGNSYISGKKMVSI